MTYRTVRSGLVSLISSLGYNENEQTVDFRNASSESYESTFILTCKDGEADINNEQQAAFLYDNQVWTIQIAFGKSSQSELEQQNKINDAKDLLLIKLDNPVNWGTFCELLRYTRWNVTAQDSYMVLTIEIKVKDALTY